MGTLRFFLAISIVVAHAGPVMGVWLVDARLAIQLFYMLSGFSMAFVWHSKYSSSQAPVRTFFLNRFLRLYPQYLVVLVLTVLLSIYAWKTQNRHPIATMIQYPISGFGGLWIYLQQITLLGMDSHMFMQRTADGALVLSANFHNGHPELPSYMFVPQAWLLSLQLVFYALVPVLLPRPKLCVAVFVLSFAARWIAWGTGYNSDPWTHRFFPFELSVFMLGVFAYWLYRWLQERLMDILSRPLIGWGGLIGLSLLMLVTPLMRKGIGEPAYWISIIAAVILAPFLFHAAMKLRWDRYLGELSYPVYISHLLVMWIGEFLFGIPLKSLVYFALPVTIPLSMLLLKMQEKIDSYRYSLVKTARP